MNEGNVSEGDAQRQAVTQNDTQETLRESETRFRLLMEQSPLGIQIFDPDGTLVQVNKTWEEIWEVNAEDVVGTYNALQDPLLDALGLKTFVARAFAGEAIELKDVKYAPALFNMPGRPRWIRARCYHIRNDQGTLKHVVLLSEDITERKHAEEQLQLSETRFRTLVEEINDTIFTVDNEGRVTYISPAIERISDYTPEEIVGQPFAAFIFPEDLEDLRTSFQRALTGILAPSEFRIVDKEGDIRYVRTFSRPIYEEDHPVGLRGVLIDITERKKHEQERERLIAELEAKNTELERFTYTVSHDLKSPLITIRGFLGLLEKDALAGDIERMKLDIDQIYDATDKMQRLLEELLELSRIGRLMNPAENVSLTELAREATDLLAGPIAKRGIVVTIAPAMPVVSGDRVRLLEVFQNLIGNAVKFMGTQPAPRIQITGTIQDTVVVCHVQDNGIGIAAQHHERIFGLFERLQKHVEGTGIGLTLVKRIIEVHGGTIQVASEGHDQGSTFTFTLPL